MASTTPGFSSRKMLAVSPSPVSPWSWVPVTLWPITWGLARMALVPSFRSPAIQATHWRK